MERGKVCRKCGKDEWEASGKHYRCTPCNLARHAVYRDSHRAEIRQQSIGYRLANLERERSRYRKDLKAHNKRNAEWVAANPDKHRASCTKWRKANLTKAAAAATRRRALKLGAPGNGVTAEQWEKVLADSLGLCAYCNERRVLTMDHIEPLSKGGAHDASNIAAACNPCNVSKSNHKLLVWLALRAA